MDYKEMTTAILGIIAAVAVLCAPVACTMNRHKLIAEAIKGGADPIAAKCAIEGDSHGTMCVVKAIGK